MEEIAEFDEYQNFNSSLQTTDITSVAKSKNFSDSDPSVLTDHDKFKCSFINCKLDYFEDECVECREIGEENKFFCFQHKDHCNHYSLSTIEESEKSLNSNSTTSVGKENQQFIFNLLKCITEVRCNLYLPIFI